jgi:hypothetical protein
MGKQLIYWSVVGENIVGQSNSCFIKLSFGNYF